jgi:undecaprenyl-diphosphatase
VHAFFSLWRTPRGEHEVRERRLFWAVIIASIPTAAIGFAIRSTLVPVFSNYYFLAGTFAVTTLLLASSRLARGTRLEISPPGAFMVGIMQGLAILPGISRSGSTIIAGQAVGLERTAAARFAFVLAIPAIIGAAMVSVLDVANLPNFNTGLMFSLFCGMIAAAVVGYLSLVLLTTIIQKAKLHWFAFYTGAVSIFCLILAFSG